MYFSNRRGAWYHLHGIDWRLIEWPGRPEFVSDDCVILHLCGFYHNCLEQTQTQATLVLALWLNRHYFCYLKCTVLLRCSEWPSAHLFAFGRCRYTRNISLAWSGSNSKFAIEMWSKSLSPSTRQACLPGCVSQYGGIRFRTDILT